MTTTLALSPITALRRHRTRSRRSTGCEGVQLRKRNEGVRIRLRDNDDLKMTGSSPTAWWFIRREQILLPVIRNRWHAVDELITCRSRFHARRCDVTSRTQPSFPKFSDTALQLDRSPPCGPFETGAFPLRFGGLELFGIHRFRLRFRKFRSRGSESPGAYRPVMATVVAKPRS